MGFEVSGIGKLSKYAEIINFEKEEKEFVDFKNLKQVPLPKVLKEFDLIINIAKLKTHSFTGVTLCMKNLYGCIPGKMKSYYHKILKTRKNFSKFLIELYEKINPQLNIIDGIEALEGNGPGASGKIIKSNLIIAGDNAPAADIIASQIMGFNPYSIYTNKFSDIKKSDIIIIGNLPKLNFKKPASFLFPIIPFFHTISSIFPSKINFNHKNCRKCNLCAKNCPVSAIFLSPYPIYDYKKCINCCCCIEICPNKAIELKEHWTKELARKIYKKLLKV